jgi:phage terminase large subunit-like protein
MSGDLGTNEVRHITYQPQGFRHQVNVWHAQSKEVYLIGGAGSGKTRAGAVWTITRAFVHPPSVHGLIVTPTYDMIRDTIVPSIEEQCIEAGITFEHKKHDKCLVLGGNRIVHLRSAEDPQRIIALTCGYGWIDEAALCTKEAYVRTSQRLRDPNANPLYAQLLCTTTPEGTRTWVADVERAANTATRVIHASTLDNAALSQDYIDHLRDVVYANDPAGWRQYVLGIATDSTGSIYTNFSDKNIAEYKPTSIEQVVVGWDFNVCWMVSPIMVWRPQRNQVHVIGEVVTKSASGTTTADHAAKVAEMVQRTKLAQMHNGRFINVFDGQTPVYAFIDASGRSQHSNSAFSDEAAVRNAGFYPRADRGNPLVRDRIASMQRALAEGKLLIDPKRAPETLRAVREHGRDKFGEPQKKFNAGEFQADHYCDALGYAVWGLLPIKYEARHAANAV